MVQFVKKRNGTLVPFDKQRIINAVDKAFLEVDKIIYDTDFSNDLADAIQQELNNEVSVEEIQDYVEDYLMQSNRRDVAKAYVRYRYKREVARGYNEDFLQALTEKINGSAVENQNANVDEMSFGGRVGAASDLVMKQYALDYCMSKKSRDNHLNNEIYIHDLNAYPIGMHNCADGDSFVKIKHNGEIKTLSLSQLANELGILSNQIGDVSNGNYQILSRDGWTKLINITRRPLEQDEELYIIRTRSGIPLKLTAGHRVPITTADGEKLVYVKDLKVGDSLLDIENVSFSEEEISECFLNLMDLEDKYPNLKLLITNISPLKNYLKFKYNVVFAHKMREYGFTVRSYPTMALNEFKRLLKDYPLSFDVLSELKIKPSGSKHEYPLFIPFTPELAKLYGYIYADGGVYVNEKQSLYQLTFTNTNEALVDDFNACYEKVFGYKLNKSYPTGWATSPCIRVCEGNKLLVALFKDFAGARKYGAADISVPQFVLQGDETIKYAYLSACIDTDGCLADQAIGYSSCCEKYCNQLALILQELGYHPHITQSGKKGDIYRFGKKSGKRNFDSFYLKINRNDEKYLLQSKLSTFKYNDTYSFNGISKLFNENKIVSIKRIVCENKDVYDLETASHWYVINNYISHNCLSIPFDDLLAKGFNTRQTDVRPANSVNTAFQLIAVIFQIQSLQQFGGVSATHLDWTMVPYVRKSFFKHYLDGLKYLGNDLDAYNFGLENKEDYIKKSITDECFTAIDNVYKYAIDMTEKEVRQAVEGMYHNLNTLQSRSGCQLPFTSINYGTCTLPEGRMITKALLDVSIEGLGKLHKTSIFPKY